MSLPSRTTRHPLLVLVVLPLLVGCAAAAPSRATLATRLDQVPRESSRSRYIGRAEIVTSPAVSAEEVVRMLRPELLRPRRPHSGLRAPLMTPVVYLNEARLGGVDLLSTVPASQVKDIRYINEVEADFRFPGVHPVGAIVVRTR